MKSEIEKPSFAEKNFKFLNKLKDHIVQIEALLAYLVMMVAFLFIADEIPLPIPEWVFGLVFLLCLKFVMRVTNPNNSTRNRLTWACSIGGMTGLILGAITDVATGGLTGGQGSLLGASLGGMVGAALGDKIENYSNKKLNQDKESELIKYGEANLYLLSQSDSIKRNFQKVVEQSLNESEVTHFILFSLDSHLKSIDKYEDGNLWFVEVHLNNFTNLNETFNKAAINFHKKHNR
ncbi:MAG: DUF3482 domain-containing protein [Chitinophagales bacterium]|nr:DUF3482 domain-containing protein [Chitinophagales bacterium]